MEWEIISQSPLERTERAITDDGDVLYRSVWMAPPLSPRTGQPMQMAFGFGIGRAPQQNAQFVAAQKLPLEQFIPEVS